MEELQNSDKNNLSLSYNLKQNNDKNEIHLKIKINKRDVNKNIYFLDNIDYVDEITGKKKFHCNLSELNESNVDIFINNGKLLDFNMDDVIVVLPSDHLIEDTKKSYNFNISNDNIINNYYVKIT